MDLRLQVPRVRFVRVFLGKNAIKTLKQTARELKAANANMFSAPLKENRWSWAQDA